MKGLPWRRPLSVVAGITLATNLAEYPLLNMDNYLTIPFSQFMSLPAVKSAFAAMNIGAITPKAPVFVYQAVHDELVPETYVAETVAQWCAGGGRVTYLRDEASEHVSLFLTGAPLALNWLNERLARRLRHRARRSACHRRSHGRTTTRE
jgi:hypothetical protein